MQNWPGSDLDDLVRFGPNGSGPEASLCAQFWQNATGPLPVSHFQTWLCSSTSTDSPDHIVQNHPVSALVLAGCVRFGPNGSGPSGLQAGVHKSLGPFLMLLS